MYIHIIMGMVSGFFWMWFFFSRSSVKTGKMQVFKAFLCGILAAFIALVVATLIDYFFPIKHDTSHKILVFFQMFCIVAPLEEYSKLIFMENLFLRKGKIKTCADAVGVGIACALGFGATENIFYFIRYPEISVFVVRFMLSILGHATFSGVMGYFLFLAAKDEKKADMLVFKGLISAILLHGVYNFLIATNTSFSFLVYIAVIGTMMFLEKQLTDESPKKINIFKYILIPVFVVSIGVFLVTNRQEVSFRHKNVVDVKQLDKLYENISPEKVERILGHPADVSEFFGRDEMFYLYFAKDVYNDYKTVKLTFVKRKLKRREIR